MNLKSTSDSKFRSLQKKMKSISTPHQEEVREIVNKVRAKERDSFNFPLESEISSRGLLQS
jgi:signal recognition particle subunit SEC65